MCKTFRQHHPINTAGTDARVYAYHPWEETGTHSEGPCCGVLCDLYTSDLTWYIQHLNRHQVTTAGTAAPAPAPPTSSAVLAVANKGTLASTPARRVLTDLSRRGH